MGMGTSWSSQVRANETSYGLMGWPGQGDGDGQWAAILTSGVLCWLVGCHMGLAGLYVR